jgi:hypothetical protein
VNFSSRILGSSLFNKYLVGYVIGDINIHVDRFLGVDRALAIENMDIEWGWIYIVEARCQWGVLV